MARLAQNEMSGRHAGIVVCAQSSMAVGPPPQPAVRAGDVTPNMSNNELSMKACTWHAAPKLFVGFLFVENF
jgi:hypothetical protein